MRGSQALGSASVKQGGQAASVTLPQVCWGMASHWQPLARGDSIEGGQVSWDLSDSQENDSESVPTSTCRL